MPFSVPTPSAGLTANMPLRQSQQGQQAATPNAFQPDGRGNVGGMDSGATYAPPPLPQPPATQPQQQPLQSQPQLQSRGPQNRPNPMGSDMALPGAGQGSPNYAHNLAMIGVGYGVAQDGWNVDAQGMQNQYNSSMAHNANAAQSLGINRQTNATAGQQLGLNREGLGVDRQYLDAQRGYTATDYANTTAGIQADLKTKQRGIGSDYTSRGAWFAPFHTADRNDAQGSADRSMVNAGLTRDRAVSGYDRDGSKLDLANRGIDLDYQNLGAQAQQIDLQAAELGISSNDYYNTLQQGLLNLGMQGGDWFMQQIQNLPAADQQQFIQEIYSAGGSMDNPSFARVMGQSQANATGNAGYSLPTPPAG